MRDNTVDLVMISDFDDEQAYRDWSRHPAHRTVSAEFLHPMAERITRGQIAL
jgi:heme-degrading monooxygenase HmoA